MALRSDELDRLSVELIELIYEGSIEPDRWQDFVDAFSEALGGAALGISLDLAAPGLPAWSFAKGLDLRFASLVSEYVAKGGIPWLTAPGALERHLREFVFGGEFFPDERVVETDFYREFLAPQGLAAEAPLGHVISMSAAGVHAAVAIHRRAGDRPLDGEDLALCNSLVPHLRRAYGIQKRLFGEREQRRALSEVVDRTSLGVLFINEDGLCRAMNASARRILELDDGLRLDRDQPVVQDAKLNEQFRASIAAAASRAARGVAAGTRIMISVERPSGGAPFTMQVVPLLEASEETMGDDLVAAVFIADPNAGVTNLPVLQELYSLTPAESGLVAELVTGRSLEEIAQRRGIQVSTARGYLKSAYRKTDTRGQRELVRLVLTGVARIATDPSSFKGS